MPFKLIFTILLIVFVAVVTGFNLDNRCNVWLFHTFEDIPVIVTILSSFVLGVIVTLPSVFIKKSKRKPDADGCNEPKTKAPKIKTEKKNRKGKEKKSSEIIVPVSDMEDSSGI